MTLLEKIFICRNESQQLAFGGALANACDDRGGIIFLQGELGAGKTTVARGFLQAMGYGERVKSPSYPLIETYQLGVRRILHIDLYRIKDSAEVEALALRDLIDDKTICLIEWGEVAKEELPPADLTCYIVHFAKGRQLRLTAHTPRGKGILQAMVIK